MRTLAILPVKSFDAAKQRLGSRLAPAARQSLAQAMVTDVLIALRECRELSATLVVTHEPKAVVLARDNGAEVVEDPVEDGQSAAALIGIGYALQQGYERVLLVPGDCPTLDVGELRTLLSIDTPVVIVPDRHGTGTNALLLSPPDVFAPSFGPESFERHRQAAQGSTTPFTIARPPSLLLDVDTPEDLDAVRQALVGRASITRALLD